MLMEKEYKHLCMEEGDNLYKRNVIIYYIKLLLIIQKIDDFLMSRF